MKLMKHKSHFFITLTSSLAFLLIGLSCHLGWAQQKARKSRDGDLTRQFNDTYQKFVEAFRLTDDFEVRENLVSETQTEIIELLSDHVATDNIAPLLPELAKVRLLQIDSLFTDTFEQHPDESTKALSLYSFAKYCGNNQRDEKSLRCFELLKEYFGDMEYGDATFGVAADKAAYFLKNLAVGKEAPLFAGEDTDGVLFRLEDYRGKVVMLRFWGDWCPACRAMYPFERELVEQHKNEPFALIGINSDSLDRCKQAQERDNLVWRTIWDGGDTVGPTSKIFQVKQWPTIIVIDADGIIRLRTQGLAEDQLTELIDRLIEEAS